MESEMSRNAPRRHTLEELVAPYEICKNLPAGAFASTVFVWAEWDKGVHLAPFVRYRTAFDADSPHPCVPAPTLQEALEALLPHARNSVRLDLLPPKANWGVVCRDCNSFSSNGADAALGVWEKLGGLKAPK